MHLALRPLAMKRLGCQDAAVECRLPSTVGVTAAAPRRAYRQVDHGDVWMHLWVSLNAAFARSCSSAVLKNTFLWSSRAFALPALGFIAKETHVGVLDVIRLILAVTLTARVVQFATCGTPKTVASTTRLSIGVYFVDKSIIQVRRVRVHGAMDGMQVINAAMCSPPAE